MDTPFNLYTTPLLFACVHGLIFAVLFFVRAGKRDQLSDFLTGLFILEGILLILPYMLGFMGIDIMWDELLFFPTNPGLLIGPTVYFFILSLTNTDFRFQKKDLFHLIPFLIYCLYRLSIYIQGAHYVQTWMAEIDLPYISGPVSVLTLLSNYMYLFFSIRYYYRYKKWVETEFSNPEEFNFSWYRNYLFLIACGITLSWVFTALNDLGFDLDYTQNWWEYFFMGIILYILSISAYTRSPVIYLHFQPDDKSNPTVKQHIESTELSKGKEKILQVMRTEKVYLNPQLSLSQMASNLEIPPQYLSQMIKEGFGKNFNEFVNEFRVEEVKNLIENPKKAHLSLLGLAYESGFNSKATFNRTFKKFTGITPSAYQSQHDSKKPENKRTFAARIEVLE